MDKTIAKSLRRNEEKACRDTIESVHARLDVLEERLYKLFVTVIGCTLTAILVILIK